MIGIGPKQIDWVPDEMTPWIATRYVHGHVIAWLKPRLCLDPDAVHHRLVGPGHELSCPIREVEPYLSIQNMVVNQRVVAKGCWLVREEHIRDPR